MDHPEKAHEKKVFSGYHGLDEMLGGFKPSELIILAARPSMGKTAFALNILKNMAVDQKKSVALFSLEMGSEQIADRILSMVSGISMSKISKGQLDTEDFTVMGSAMELLSETKIFIDDK